MIQEVDLIEKLNVQMDIVSNVMHKNIEKTMDNMEDLNTLSRTSMELKENSEQFNKKAVKAKRKMYWKNKKIIFIASSLVGVIVWIILV